MAKSLNQETYFFREPHHFTFLIEEYLMPLNGSSDTSLFVVCVGCATGEEPYSIAMLFSDFLENNPWIKLRFTIHALDICSDGIEKARKGIYGRNSFRQPQIENSFIQKFFKSNEDRFILDRRIKDLVNFHTFDILSDSFPAHWRNSADLVFFRNICIYLDNEEIKRAIDKVADILKDDGSLLVAASELNCVKHPRLRVVKKGNAYVHAKVRSSADLSPPATMKPALEAAAPRPQVAPIDIRGLEAHRINLRFQEAIEAFSAESFEKAREIAEDLVSNGAENPLPQLLLGYILLNRGEMDRAFSISEACRRRWPLLSEVSFFDALILKMSDKKEEAARRLKETIFIEPRFWMAHALLGEIHKEKGEFRVASRHFKQAIKYSDEKLSLFCVKSYRESLIALCEKNLEKLAG